MKKTIILALGSLCFALPAAAQWGSNRVKGNGVEATEKRQVGSYDRISVSHIIHATLVPGKEGELVLEGEENLLEHVVTEVSGNQLILKAERGYQLEPGRGSEGIRIRVPVEDLVALEVSGAAEVTGQGAFSFPQFEIQGSGAGEMHLELRSATLAVDVSGACEITLKGTAGRLEIEGSGASELDAYGLQAREVEARISGSAEARVVVEEALSAQVSGAGDLHYRGNPEKLQSRASGAGSVSKS